MAKWNSWRLAASVFLFLVIFAKCDDSPEGRHGNETESSVYSFEEEEEEDESLLTSLPSCSPVSEEDKSIYVLRDNHFSLGTPTGVKFKLNYTGEPLECADDGKPVAGNLDSHVFTDNGHFGVRGCNEKVGKFVYSWYTPEEFCVERNQSGYVEVVKYCMDPLSSPELIINQMLKCCPLGYAIKFVNKSSSCARLELHELNWAPTYYDSGSVNKGRCLKLAEQRIHTRLQSRVSKRDRSKYHCPTHDYKARATYTVVNSANETEVQPRARWRILDNGTQIMYHLPIHGGLLWGTWAAVTNDAGDDLWCYDKLKLVQYSAADPNATSVILTTEVAYHLRTRPDIHEEYECGPLKEKSYIRTGDELEPDCDDEPHHEEAGPGGVTVAYIAMFITALVPLMLTLIAYWLTWSSQNLHGWTVFSHIFSIFFMNMFLGAAMLISVVYGDVNRSFKVFLGVSAHFFTIATFMWLTMINFDLWWTFRKLKSSQMDKGLDRFAAYSVIAWGVPIVFVTVGLVLDSQYGDFGYDSDCDVRIPMYGHNFVLARSAEGIYMYFPLAVLMVMNCVFFFSTCTKIYSPKCKRKGMLHKQAGLDRQSVELFLKLFVVMGCTLTADAIAWSIIPDAESLEEFPKVVIFFDAFNILGRAFLIFIIFACKPQVLAKVQKILVPGRSAGRATFRRPSSSGKFSTQDTTDRDHSRIKMQVIA